MINGKSVLALIPARGGSKGLPRKNARKIAGKPLVCWPIAAACGSEYVDSIICSTDDEEISALASNAGAEVPFERPDSLAGDKSASADVVIHALNYMSDVGKEFHYILLLEPTSPLTESSDIDNALLQLDKKSAVADSIVGVSKVEHTHPEFDVRLDDKKFIAPYSVASFEELKRRQDVEEIFFLDGSLYISKVGAFRAHSTFYHSKTLGYVTPRWKSFEIDEYIDMVCVEAILNNRQMFTDEN